MNEGWKEMKERKESRKRGKDGRKGRREGKEGRERKQKGRRRERVGGSPETYSIANHLRHLVDAGMIHLALEHLEEIRWRTISGQLGYFISSISFYLATGNKLKGEFSGVYISVRINLHLPLVSHLAAVGRHQAAPHVPSASLMGTAHS